MMNGIGMITGDGIDWNALLNDGQLFSSIGGGWNDGFVDDPLLNN